VPAPPKTILTRLRTEAGYRWRFAERHEFVDRSRGSDRMLMILGGHKPRLWPWTLARDERSLPPDIDVCLITPGVARPELRTWAERAGWSYLTTRGGHVSVAQNLAIRAHPNARYVFKLDEDIFIPSDYFEPLLRGYERVRDELDFSIGLCAPTLNINGFSYVDYLERLGLTEEYRRRFGPTRRASDGIPAFADGEAAVWLWSHGLPVDDTARRFAEAGPSHRIVPHRYSIGAILFERDLWDEMRGFKRLERSPGLGEDEGYICASCVSLSRVMVVLGEVYAGHFAFGPQQPAMEAAFGNRLTEF
jgi:hypothetical protein